MFRPAEAVFLRRAHARPAADEIRDATNAHLIQQVDMAEEDRARYSIGLFGGVQGVNTAGLALDANV